MFVGQTHEGVGALVDRTYLGTPNYSAEIRNVKNSKVLLDVIDAVLQVTCAELENIAKIRGLSTCIRTPVRRTEKIFTRPPIFEGVEEIV